MATVAKLVVQVTSDTARARAGLMGLNQNINSVSRSTGRMTASVNRGSTAISRHGNVVRQTTVSIGRMGAAANRSGGSMRRYAVIAKAATFATAAMQPVVTQAVAVLGGLVTAFASAGLAAGAFGLAVVGAFQNSEKVKDKLKDLSSAFADFSRATEKYTVGPISKVLDGMAASLGKIVPLVGAAAPVFDRLATSFQKWVDTRLDDWVKFLSKHGVPMLDDLIKGFKGLGATFGQMLIQFSPFAKEITAFLASKSSDMAAWAKNGGFTQWLKSIESMRGPVLEFFRSLGDALANVNAAMRILGPLALGITTAFLKIVAALPPSVLATLIGLWLVWKKVLIAFSAVMWLFAKRAAIVRGALMLWAAAQWVLNAAMTANPIGIVIVAIGALVSAIVWIATKTTWFQTAWKAAWNGIKTAFFAVWNFIKNNWKNMVAILTGPMGIAVRLITHNWNTIRNVVVTVWNFIVRFIRAAFNGILSIIRSIMTGIRNVWSTGWNWIASKAKATWNGLRAGVRAFKDSIVSAFRTMVEGVKTAWNKLKAAVAAPVKFFVNTVYDKGLRKVWNNTAGKIPGVPDLPAAPKIGFATGGYTGNGGKYEPKGVVHGGEFVLRKEATKKIPRGVLQHMNTTGRLPGYASGGPVPNIPGTGYGQSSSSSSSRRKDKSGGVTVHGGGGVKVKAQTGIGQLWDSTWNIVKRGAATVVGKALSPIRGLANGIGKRFPKSGMMGTATGKWVNSGIDSLLKFIRGKEQDPPMGGGFNPAAPWKSGDGKRTSFRGGMMNVRTMRMLMAAEKLFGGRFSVTQGSYSTSVGASAGTHAGGGVLDLAQTSDKAVGALRGAGFAAWSRTRKEGFSPHIHAVAVGDQTLSGAAKRQVDSFFKGRNGLANNGPDTFKGGGAGGSGKWAGVASQVLQELGQFNPTNLANVLKAIKKESGGNPNAVNNWDINARNGVASRGLLQVIPPTFNAYAGKYKKKGITDPYANIYAAVRYAKSRYGAGWSARMARPGGYANGTSSAKPGWRMVGERGPEMVNFGGGERVLGNRDFGGGGDTYIINFNGPVGDKKQMEDWVVSSVTSAKKKGRLK